MIRSLWAFALLLAWLGPSPMQAASGLEFGLLCGPASATQVIEDEATGDVATRYRWGLDTGCFLQVAANEHINWSLEAHYIQKGFSLRDVVRTPYQPEGNGQFTTRRPRFDYLSILMAGRYGCGSCACAPYLLAGPRLDVELGSHGIDEDFGDVASVDIGFSLGAGIEFAVADGMDVLAEFRWSPGLTSIAEIESLQVKNRSFEFLAGLRCPI